MALEAVTFQDGDKIVYQRYPHRVWSRVSGIWHYCDSSKWILQDAEIRYAINAYKSDWVYKAAEVISVKNIAKAWK